MSIVKVKTKGQVTLPARLREQVGLRVGDIMEATVKAGTITLTPQSIVDKRIAESIADYKAGRTHGPFNSAKEMIAFLDKQSRKAKK
jgi:AbrB family looped-hinge helix DNA binding protein